MNKPFKKYQVPHNESGMALIVVLLVFAVISIIGLSLMSLAASNMKMSSSDRNYQSAYYIAESGINRRLSEVSPQLKAAYGPASNLTEFYNRIDTALQLGTVKNFNDFDVAYGDQPEANVTIEKLQNDTLVSYTKNYKITSTGTINQRSRTVTKIIHITWKPKSSVTIPANTAIFSNDSYTVKNYKIIGSVGSNGLITLQGGQATISGSKNSNVGTRLDVPEFPSFNAPTGYPDFTGSTLTMDKDKAFNNFTVSDNGTVIIKMGTYNHNLVINKLTLGSGAKVYVDTTSGTGKLSLYVKSLVMKSGSVLNHGGDFQNLFVFLDNGAGTSISGLINGSIYAKNTNIEINLASGVGVSGHVITGGTNVSIKSNDVSAASPGKNIYAPLANVDLNASFKGSIVAKSITSQGNDDALVFEYAQINYDDSPVFVDNGSAGSPVRDLITSDPVREK